MQRACGHELHDDAQVRLLDHGSDEVDHVAVAHLVRVRVRVRVLGLAMKWIPSRW